MAGWYHCIDLGNGNVTKGTFDIRPYLSKYGFPDDLRGKRVLDVGRASGFFSFELEKRGASVIATDLPNPFCKDYVGGEITRSILKARFGEKDRNDFSTAHKALGSKVVAAVASLYDLSNALNERFDLVFVGSVLCHVRDPAGALHQVFAVTKESGRVIVANPIVRTWSRQALMRLHGLDGESLTTWWLPNKQALEHLMRAAGFQNVRTFSTFVLKSTDGKHNIPHAVIHGERLSDEETRKSFVDIMSRHYKL